MAIKTLQNERKKSSLRSCIHMSLISNAASMKLNESKCSSGVGTGNAICRWKHGMMNEPRGLVIRQSASTYSENLDDSSFAENASGKNIVPRRTLHQLVRGLAVTTFVLLCCSAVTSMPNSVPFASLSYALRGFSGEAISASIRSAWAGLAAGCLHTLAGADHLAALTPLTIGRSYLRASLLGALWGFGHSTGQLILGLLMVLLKDRFQQLVPALSKWGGTTVGLTLLAIGALGVYESFFETHEEEDMQQVTDGTFSASSDDMKGVDIQSGGSLAFQSKGEKKRSGLATFATGIIYGLQPDALFVIIPALALPTKLAATTYILMFVFGTVAAMGLYAGLIGATSNAIRKNNEGLTKKLSGAAAFIAIAIGIGVLASGWGVELPFLSFDH